MYLEFTATDGQPFSVDRSLIKLYSPARVLLANETFTTGCMLVIQNTGSYYTIETYEQVKAMMGRKQTVRKPKAQTKPATVLKMSRKPKMEA